MPIINIHDHIDIEPPPDPIVYETRMSLMNLEEEELCVLPFHRMENSLNIDFYDSTVPYSIEAQIAKNEAEIAKCVRLMSRGGVLLKIACGTEWVMIFKKFHKLSLLVEVSKRNENPCYLKTTFSASCEALEVL